jgi:hypothetical protein
MRSRIRRTFRRKRKSLSPIFSVRCYPCGIGEKSTRGDEKIKGERLKTLKRGEIEWLMSHLKFDGKHLLREAGMLYP